MTNKSLSLRQYLIGFAACAVFFFAVGAPIVAQDDANAQQADAVAVETTNDAEPAPAPDAQTADAQTADAQTADAQTADAQTAPDANAPENDAQNEKPAETAENNAAATESDSQNAASNDESNANAQSIEASQTVVEEVKKPFNWRAFFIFGGFILLIAIAFAFSRILARYFRMPENAFGYFLIFFCFVGGAISTYSGIKEKRVNLGVDLRGGSMLVYSVEPNKGSERETVSNEEMGALKNAIAKRINPSGVKEISIQELGANSEIKITIPEADDVELQRIKNVISSTGQLNFRILASRNSNDPDEQQAIEYAAREENKNADVISLDATQLKGDGVVVGASWLPVDPTQEDSIARNDVVTRPSQVQLASNDEAKPNWDVLVLKLETPYAVDGEHVEYVREGMGNLGEPLVHFTMTAEGARHMERLTDRYRAGEGRVGRQLGVVFNGRLFNAPTIQSTIGKNGQITFGNTLSAEDVQRIRGEVKELLAVMHAGVLPAEISKTPVTEAVTGPSLGADTIRKGASAIVWGGCLVLVFMIVYYGFGGCVATFAVLMNLVLIMTAMIAMRAAFTLPGLAGLVLTVGMAVDANVLIFERIREELNNGANLRAAIRTGYQRAFTAIFDSNITTMLTAWILYLVGSEQIKSFAVTLFLGVLFSMFTATYICRIIFQSCEKAGWLTKRCVSPIIPGFKQFGRPNWDFFAIAKKTYWISIVVIVVGLVGAFVRGAGIFDVDFVGGVEIQTVFTEPVDIEELRATKIEGVDALTVSELSLTKDRFENAVQPNTCYSISASCPKNVEAEDFRAQLENALRENYGDKLRSYSFAYEIGDTQMVKREGAAVETPETSVVVKVEPKVSAEVVKSYFDNAADATEGVDKIEFVVRPVATDAEQSAEQSAENVAESWNVVFESDSKDAVEKLAQITKTAVERQSVFEASNVVGSSVAGYARNQGALAILGSLACIIAYLWFRFKHAVFGISAVVGLVHDVCFTLGLIALSQWTASSLGWLGITQFKIGLATVAAFLTLIGYSLNDTIVLFDRMREVRGKSEAITKDVINRATNETFSRTLLTSITTGFSVLVLYVFGGSGIHTFAFAMLVGVIVGTYSSIFICAPFLYFIMQRRAKSNQSLKKR